MNPVKLFLILGAVAAFTIAITLGQTDTYPENNSECRGNSGKKYNNSKGDSCTCVTPLSAEAACTKRSNGTTTAGNTNTSTTAAGSTTSTRPTMIPPLPINF